MNGTEPTTAHREGRIDTCAVCEQALPLRLPGPEERGTEWVCAGCGARYEAVLAAGASLELLQHVHPTEIRFEKSNLLHPPEAIREFISAMVRAEYGGSERRGAKRHPIVTPVVVMPMNGEFRPAEGAFMVVTRDISTTGLALISTREVSTELLAIELPAAGGEKMQVVMRLARCRPVGRFYKIAGPFVFKMGD